MSIFGSQEEQSIPSTSDIEDAAATGPASIDAEDIAVDSVSEDEGISDDDDKLDRPRHVGSRRQWRHLTKLDRQVAQAQEKLEDEDLSIHLYNAHILKTRARRQSSDGPQLKTWQSKDRWRRPGEWVPNNLWTAWPLEERIVPRSNTSHAKGSIALHYPTQELEHIIMACITAHARQEMQENLGADSRQADSAEDDGAALTQSIDPSSQSEAEHEVSMKRRYEALQTPLPLADDVKAWQLLHPVVRRTISSLDKLLESLHRARQNRHGGASDSEHEAEASSSVTDQKLNDQTSSHATSRKRRKKSKDTPAYQSRVLTRDWSEVLGHATYSGWDGTVVERTVARCSELFAERMDIHTSAKPVQPHTLDSSSYREQGSTANRGNWFCPERDCKRHMEPFRLRRSLLSHTSKEHGYTIPWGKQDDAMQLSTSESGSEDDQEDQGTGNLDSAYDLMHNGIHLDGFLQPITMRPEWMARRDSNSTDA